MPGRPKRRFAVGTADDQRHLQHMARDMGARGLDMQDLSCLGFQRVLADRRLPLPRTADLVPLPFPASPELIVCTPGRLARALAERLQSGVRHIREALGHWLISRHAQHFEDAVHAGKIVLWLEVADAAAEHRACQSLLAHSSTSVGLHDLIL
jgi:uncharacterized membrane protein (DUF2068 family)